ncbi:MAG: hypothetical protein ACREDO_12790 [Methyloceanibacter sp.]
MAANSDAESELRRAAELLARARLPVFGGLQTDIAGAAAAIALAQKLGGVVDHAEGESLSRASRLMRETGAAPASFGEVRNRADIVIIIGKRPLERDPDLAAKLFPKEKGLPRPGRNKRSLILLSTGEVSLTGRVPAVEVGGKTPLPDLVAMLSARVRQNRIEIADRKMRGVLDDLAETLRNAAFAVFVCDPAELDVPVLYTILEMARQLGVTTRASVLSLAPPGNGEGVNLCCTWTCALPVRTSFAREIPEHNAWTFAAERLIENGEADALIWIDALEGAGAGRPRGVPTVVLATNAAAGEGGDIAIDVACAGRDHDAALYLPAISGIGIIAAGKPNGEKPTVAAALNRIGELIDGREAA